MTKLHPIRHLSKAITWRIIGTIDTCILGWLVSGDATVGLKIGISELLTKILLYYLHERIWYRLKILSDANSRTRHILKTITWRFVGTIDTVFLAWFISGKAEVGLSIGGLELISKMLLYYFHERVWYRLDFGKIKDENGNFRGE